jgi:hypothetical protein
MILFAVAVVAIAGLAFGRRKTLKDDVVRAKDSGKGVAGKVMSRIRRESDETTQPADTEGADDSATVDDSDVDDADDTAN